MHHVYERKSGMWTAGDFPPPAPTSTSTPPPLSLRQAPARDDAVSPPLGCSNGHGRNMTLSSILLRETSPRQVEERENSTDRAAAPPNWTNGASPAFRRESVGAGSVDGQAELNRTYPHTQTQNTDPKHDDSGPQQVAMTFDSWMQKYLSGGGPEGQPKPSPLQYAPPLPPSKSNKQNPHASTRSPHAYTTSPRSNAEFSASTAIGGQNEYTERPEKSEIIMSRHNPPLARPALTDPQALPPTNQQQAPAGFVLQLPLSDIIPSSSTTKTTDNTSENHKESELSNRFSMPSSHPELPKKASATTAPLVKKASADIVLVHDDDAETHTDYFNPKREVNTFLHTRSMDELGRRRPLQPVVPDPDSSRQLGDTQSENTQNGAVGGSQLRRVKSAGIGVLNRPVLFEPEQKGYVLHKRHSTQLSPTSPGAPGGRMRSPKNTLPYIPPVLDSHHEESEHEGEKEKEEKDDGEEEGDSGEITENASTGGSDKEGQGEVENSSKSAENDEGADKIDEIELSKVTESALARRRSICAGDVEMTGTAGARDKFKDTEFARLERDIRRREEDMFSLHTILLERLADTQRQLGEERVMRKKIQTQLMDARMEIVKMKGYVNSLERALAVNHGKM